MLFSRWGAFTYRFRRPIALITVVLAIGSLTLASRVTDSLVSGGWTDPRSESAAVSTRLADEFGAGRGSIVALFEGDDTADARSAAFQQTITASLGRLAAFSGVRDYPSRVKCATLAWHTLHNAISDGGPVASTE